jgi:DNA-directed RNA polymerase beta' subunit
LDIITGAFDITNDKTFINPKDFDRYISYITRYVNRDSLEIRRKKFSVSQDSGKLLFSALLPEDFYYNNKGILIQDGILIKGVIKDAHIGDNHKSIIQVLYKDYGILDVEMFLTDIYFLVPKFVNDVGFSIGIKDCLANKEISQKLINEKINEAKITVSGLYNNIFSTDQDHSNIDSIELKRREDEVCLSLNNVKTIGDRIAKEAFPENNPLRIMQSSGAKGKESNMAQLSGLIGQIYINNKFRIPLDFSGGKRCLPIFDEGDLDPESRGFCVNSYSTGLEPHEYFFQAMATREGIIDRVINTADTGYINKSMIKLLEDEKIAPDNSVRHYSLEIIQYIFGDDGLNSEKLENIDLNRGKIAFFIDLERWSGRLNNKFNYYLIDNQIEDTLIENVWTKLV